MKKIFLLLVIVLMVFNCFSVVFAGKMIIKDHVLVKYKADKYLKTDENDKYPFPIAEQIDKLIIPEGVISIGPNAFKGWMGTINSIILPSTLKYINPKGMFMPMEYDQGGVTTMGLKEIIVNPNNKTYCSVDGVLFNKEKTKIVYYPRQKKDKKYIIPSTVEYIPTNAFPDEVYYYGYEIEKHLEHYEKDDFFLGLFYLKGRIYPHLEELVISKNVKRIGEGAICSLFLKKLTIENPDIIIEHNAFMYSFWYKSNETANYLKVETILEAPEKVKDKYFYPYEYDDDNYPLFPNNIYSYAVYNVADH